MLKVTPENGVSFALLQSCSRFGASGDACLETEQNLPITWVTKSSPNGACSLRCVALRKEKSRGRCTPNLVFCIALCKGSHIKPCRHLRACRYLGVAQGLELGEELCFGCKFTAVFYGGEKSSPVLFRAQVSSCTDVGQLQRECNLRAFPSASTSIWAGGLPGVSLG